LNQSEEFDDFLEQKETNDSSQNMEPPMGLLNLHGYTSFLWPSWQPSFQHHTSFISLVPTFFATQLWTRKYCF
jgi:hypothetical protein